MLSILNNLNHSYVAMPIIATLKKQGFFEALCYDKPVGLNILVKKLNAN
jgi:hypothetical protein